MANNLGPYRLVNLHIAAPAVQIWEAQHEENNGKFVIKVLQQKFKDNAQEIALLKNEFEVAEKFENPRVTRAIEFNRSGELPFLVLEAFGVANLKTAFRESPGTTTKLVEQAAEGLFYLHEQGWIHRDVKPDNLRLTDEGSVKLIDFSIAQKPRTGLAKWFGRSKVQGTRTYMSPEQIKGETLDPRADVYSFGCSLFEILTGRAAYTASTPDELLNKHLTAPIPSVLALNTEVTPEAAGLVTRMMAKEKKQRPGSMWDVLKELRAIKLLKYKAAKKDAG